MACFEEVSLDARNISHYRIVHDTSTIYTITCTLIRLHHPSSRYQPCPSYLALAIVARPFASPGPFSLVVVCTEVHSMDMLG